MTEFSSFHPIYLGILLIAMAVFYAVGELMVSNKWHASLKFSARFFLGMLLTISTVATVKFGIGSMLFPVFILLLYLIYHKFRIEQGKYSLSVSWKPVVLTLIWTVIVFIYHAFFGNMDLGELAYVPNTDFSYYSGKGHLLLENEIESITSDPWLFVNNGKTFYHYPDLYLSGILSRLFNIMPIYAYSLISCSILVVVVSLMLFSLGQTFHLSTKKSIALVFIVLTFLGLPNLFNWMGLDFSLFDLFVYSFPALAAKPYAIMGCMVMFGVQLLQVQFKPVFALSFLSLSALANPGISLIFPMVLGALIALKFLFSVIKKSNWFGMNEWSYFQLLITFAISCIPYVGYGVIDGRMGSSGGGMELSELVYLIFHTNIRFYFSLLLFFPLILGIWYWVKQKSSFITLLLLACLIFLGFTFGTAYSILQGNTIQMFVMGLMYLVIPLLVMGLLKLTESKSKTSKVWNFVIGIIIIQCSFNLWKTNGYRGHLDWSYNKSGKQLEEHLNRNQLNKNELRDLIETTEGKTLAYFSNSIYNDTLEHSTMPHYNDFTFLVGIQPTCSIYAINMMEKSEGISTEMNGILENTQLTQYKNQFPEKFESEYLKDLSPDGLISQTAQMDRIPSKLPYEVIDTTDLGRYSILWFKPL